MNCVPIRPSLLLLNMMQKDASPNDNIGTGDVYEGADISCKSWRDREKFSHLWENIYCSCSLAPTTLSHSLQMSPEKRKV